MTKFIKSPTYVSWECMKQRCNNQNNKAYQNYGGRGITYETRWEEYDSFLEDMGERPLGTTLDRIDVDGDYCKSNCRWTTRKEQQHNLRTHKRKDVGIVYVPDRKRWLAKICVDYKQFAKRFKTKEDAINWRKEMELLLWQKQQ